ncbi:MAG: hypothetical protein ABSC06_31020 [Rhodopila sp.]
MADHLTQLQRTNLSGFPKPGELIEITGAHELEAPDRAILNLLYQHAHNSGRLTEGDAAWELPLAVRPTCRGGMRGRRGRRALLWLYAARREPG